MKNLFILAALAALAVCPAIRAAENPAEQYQKDPKDLDEQSDQIDKKLDAIQKELEAKKAKILRHDKDAYDNHTIILSNGDHAINTKEGPIAINERLETTHKLEGSQLAEFEAKLAEFEAKKKASGQ